MPSINLYKRKRKQKDGSYKTSEAYWAEIRYGRNGPKFFRSTGKISKREAETEAQKIVKHIERHELPYIGVELMTLDTMFGRWWKEYAYKLKGADVEKFRVQNLLNTIGHDLPIKDIDDHIVGKFIARRREKVKDDTIKRELTTLRSAMTMAKDSWGEEIEKIKWSRHKLKEAKERDVYSSPDEMAHLISFLSKNIKLAALWSLYSMARLGETKGLLKSDVYFEERFAWVNGKTGKRRILLNDYTVLILKQAFKTNPGDEFVFDLTNRRRQWERARKLAARSDLRWHDLRHIGATWLRQFATSDIKEIQVVLGHSNIGTTQRYAHVANDDAIDTMNKMPNILESGTENEESE